MQFGVDWANRLLRVLCSSNDKYRMLERQQFIPHLCLNATLVKQLQDISQFYQAATVIKIIRRALAAAANAHQMSSSSTAQPF